uniref:Uncharacterized protein MANES_04G031200 n=1 Tax=Rhizophora mucronata TaxID=61149 RepID=A0A2P2K4A2_RHIMU
MSKSLWMATGTDGDPAYDNLSRIETKRPRQWFVDAAEPDLFPNKKQAVQTPSRTSRTGISNTDVPSWDNTTGLQSVPNQFIHRLFGPEARSVDFTESNVCATGTGNSDASVNLSASHTMEDPEAFFNYGGFRKVKVSQVKDGEDAMHASKGHTFTSESNSDISTVHALNRERENNFISMEHAYGKEDENVTLMGHAYIREDDHAVSTSPTYIKGDDSSFPITDTYSKDDDNMISFGGFPDAHDIIPVGRPASYCGESYSQPTVQTPVAGDGKELNASNGNAALSNTRTGRLKPESVSRNKLEIKTTRKEAPNSFPSNVRSLISTGMLDGVPVKYVSLSREELRGIIKGSGYLCGCQLCNYSKVSNSLVSRFLTEYS